MGARWGHRPGTTASPRTGLVVSRSPAATAPGTTASTASVPGDRRPAAMDGPPRGCEGASDLTDAGRIEAKLDAPRWTD
jgi:hypothetical protein